MCAESSTGAALCFDLVVNLWLSVGQGLAQEGSGRGPGQRQGGEEFVVGRKMSRAVKGSDRHSLPLRGFGLEPSAVRLPGLGPGGIRAWPRSSQVNDRAVRNWLWAGTCPNLSGGHTGMAWHVYGIRWEPSAVRLPGLGPGQRRVEVRCLRNAKKLLEL